MRREFPCGHKGKGKFCHRCQQEAAQRSAELAAPTGEETDVTWRATFDEDVIDLRCLQTRSAVLKAREILRRVARGESHMAVNGKRWTRDRTIIAVRIGWMYRLVFREQGSRLTPVRCMTHEDYNHLKPESLRVEKWESS